MGNSKKKAEQLGMPHGTASGRLRKQIMFALIQYTKLDICFRCKGIIEKVEELSIEHKVPWLDSEDPVGLFFDMDNIAFSHLSCNCSASASCYKSGDNTKSVPEHGTYARYSSRNYSCNCSECKEAMRLYKKEWRSKQ